MNNVYLFICSYTCLYLVALLGIKSVCLWNTGDGSDQDVGYRTRSHQRNDGPVYAWLPPLPLCEAQEQ